MRLAAERVRVTVPASSANLGPGYDSFGLALNLRDVVEVTTTASPQVRVDVEGESSVSLPTDENHLVAHTILETLDEVGVPRTGLYIRTRNAIPHGRGLGSSAAAVVAGILAVRGLIDEPEALDSATVLAMASRREGHPDNAAPVILGGLTLAWTPGPHAVRLALHSDIRVVVAIPPGRLATSKARAVLPDTVPHADAAFQLARSGLLVEALGHRPELLLAATADRLHQEYRRVVMPDSLALVDALRRQGVAAVVSGAGPTVLAFGVEGHTDALAVMTKTFGGTLGGWQIMSLEPDTVGGVVERF